MNLKQRTSLSLLFMSLSTVPAHAALSDGVESGGVSIETASDHSAQHSLDQLLGGGNNSDLFDSILQQHDSAALAANSTMDGHFEGIASERPVQFGPHNPSEPTSSSAAYASSAPAQAPNLSLTAAVHMGAQAESAPAAVTSSGSSSPTSSQFNATAAFSPSVAAAPVPLPAAGLLLASGLAGLTGLRRRHELDSLAGHETC